MTRVLSLAGAQLPNRLMGSGEGNATGHWEPNELVAYHDVLLGDVNSSWLDWRGPDWSRLAPGRHDGIRREIGQILAADYGDAALSVVKDPRICRLAPLFIAAAEETGMTVAPVLMFRNPLDVMDSLAARSANWPRDYSVVDAAMLWLRHVLDAEAATRGMARAFASYDGLMHDWRRVLENVSNNAKVAFPYGAAEIAAQVDEFLSSEQRHHRHKTEELLLQPYLRGWVSDTYEALRVLENAPSSEVALMKIDGVRHAVAHALPALVAFVDVEKSARGKAIAAADARRDVAVREAGAAAERAQALDQQVQAVAGERDQAREEARQATIAGETARAALEAQIGALTSERDAAREQARLAETLHGEATSHAATLADELSGVRQSFAGVQETRAALEAQIEELRSERDAALEQARLAETLHGDAKSHAATLADELSGVRQSFAGAQETRVALEAQIEELRSERDAARERLRLIEVTHGAAQAREETLVQLLNDRELEHGADRSRIAEMAARLETLEAALNDARAQHDQAVNAADAERQRLEAEVAAREAAGRAHADAVADAFRNSTSWRLTAPIRAVKGGWKKSPTGVSGRLIDLRNAGTWRVVNAKLEGSSLLPSNSNPQIIVDMSSRLAAGWYTASLELHSVESCKPRFYFDVGEGFSEFQSVSAEKSLDGSYLATFYLPCSVDRVRIDPHESQVEISIGDISLKRVRGMRKIRLLGGLAFDQAKKDRVQLFQNFRKYRSVTRTRRVIDLARYKDRQGGAQAYSGWIKRHDYIDSRDRAGLSAKIAALKTRPLISVVMPVYNPPAKLLEEAIQSVVDQVYPNWEFCIANDASTKAYVKRILDRWAAKDARIKVVHRAQNGHICAATNSAFQLVQGSWVALLDHDDLLRPNALAEVALALDENPQAALIYSDEDKIDERGSRFDPHFKCDFSPELFRSMNYFNHLTVHRTDLVNEVGGWRAGFEGSQDYDLNLRIIEKIDVGNIVHIPKVLYHWRAVSGSTALAGSEKGYAFKAGFKALEQHLQRTGQDALVREIPGLPFYRVQHQIKRPHPSVSLIIPTRDRLDLLQVAVQSILEKTTYDNYEIVIVDNGSVEPATKAYFEDIERRANVRVLPYPGEFNFSAINNYAVERCDSEIIGLINNDIEVISPDWLTEMVSWAQQDRVGCVGAKLYYPDGRIQHAGVILGIGGVANHAHLKRERADPGYFGRAMVLQNYSAVTAACLLVRRSVYLGVGGLDADNLKVAFNDVDFCLRVQAAGYLNVWTPFAELYHHESPSRGHEDTPEKIARFQGEVSTMQDRWSGLLELDRFYSINLCRQSTSFAFAI